MTFVDEPEAAELDPPEQEELGRKRHQGRPRLFSMFARGKSEARIVSLPSVGSFFFSASMCLDL